MTHSCEFYEKIKTYTLNECEKRTNGYPRLGSSNNEIVISPNFYWIKFGCQATKNDERSMRSCDRCLQKFKVDSNGFPLNNQRCFYHWGKYQVKIYNGRELGFFSCCGKKTKSFGCTIAENHVIKTDIETRCDSTGYVQTTPINTNQQVSMDEIYGLDCEMCYTTKGLEVAHVCLIRYDLTVKYESFIKPDNPIIDYNTRFSGITKSKLENTTKTLKDVQKDLTAIISDQTILIGHSLENDLVGLKIMHKLVVDTSVLFPHYRGNGYKRSLRDLVRACLNIEIQNSALGHSPIEDAVACMKVVFKKAIDEMDNEEELLSVPGRAKFLMELRTLWFG